MEQLKKMRTKTILFITILVIAAASIGCRSNLTAQTTGQITRVAIDRDTKTTTRKTSSNKKKKTTKTSIETEIDYRYTVNGKTYDGYSEKDGDVQRDFQNDAQVTVCYDPANPEESDVYASGSKCG